MSEKVWFENSNGDKLCGILSDVGKNTPITILCHGLATGKDGKTYTSLEEILNKNKISTFRFDFYGHGESGGVFSEITITEAVDDILKSVEFVKRRGYNKIGLFGSSFGGLASLIATSKSKCFTLLALKCPDSNYVEKYLQKKSQKEIEEWKRKGYIFYKTHDGRKLKLGYSLFEDSEKNDGYLAAKKIKIPAIIVHGDEDLSVPVKQSIKTAGIINNCRLEIIKGAGHFFSKQKDFNMVQKLISDFIIKNVK